MTVHTTTHSRSVNNNINNISRKQLESEWTTLAAVSGVRLGTAAAGIKHKNRDDVLLLEICEGGEVAGIFTQNAFCAAPVIIARQHLASATPRYLLVNSGNANAGTGQLGIENARACCIAIGELTHCSQDQVLPFSTGVIGEHLPVNKIVAALPQAFNSLAENNWQLAAKAIMTTDTLPKAVSRTATIDGHTITVTGIAKGAGMICPNMATLLTYIATDAAVSNSLLQTILQNLAEKTFNRITVDGDTSTNDACMLIATGKSALPKIESEKHPNYMALYELLSEVFQYLATAIILDAEGASKLVNITVTRGINEAECETVAYTIAHSPLVKTALFASDPNWGRILAAVGRAGIHNLDISKINILLNGVSIVKDGARDSTYTESAGQKAMQNDQIAIDVDLNRGNATANVWTCDLSYDYVKINAEYRT